MVKYNPTEYRGNGMTETAHESMYEIFISYKREDETRVAQLALALQDAGHSVWWDRHLAAGESWHAQIRAALDAAKCVIVVWTQESVGPGGDFVRDEAMQAKRRGILIPVMLDKVDPPLGFGEIQSIDLSHWKDNPRDPFFRDLCDAITAKLEGRPVPPAKAPMSRLVRRLAWSGFASMMGAGSITIGFNLFSVNDQMCTTSFFQPQISDLCGALGLSNRPTREERIAWENRERGSCVALRTHIEQFPQGFHRSEAADLLTARRITQTETWIPAIRELTLFVTHGGEAHADQSAAQAAATMRAQTRAGQLCKGFAATNTFRLISSASTLQVWHCNAVTGGIACGFEGDAVCEVEERHIVETENCGN